MTLICDDALSAVPRNTSNSKGTTVNEKLLEDANIDYKHE